MKEKVFSSRIMTCMDFERVLITMTSKTSVVNIIVKVHSHCLNLHNSLNMTFKRGTKL